MSIQTIKLHARNYADGQPLLILHGLFGSHKNWHQQARSLSASYAVHSLDLRNHGSSPHNAVMDYPAMAADVVAWMQANSIKKTHLLGHSMGGKVAMQIALNQAEYISRLIIVDIAPKAYSAHHEDILKAMAALDFNLLTTRQAVDVALQNDIPDDLIRQFIMTNLVRDQQQKLQWQLNLSAISSEYKNLSAPPSCKQAFENKTLFIKGGRSDYLQTGDETNIRQLFPNSEIKTLADCDHWPHAEAPEAFQKMVLTFLQANE